LENHHLFVVDGHNLHITIEVEAKVRQVGLHLVILSFHKSHALLPLFLDHSNVYSGFIMTLGQ
jgi:hypothetical protein